LINLGAYYQCYRDEDVVEQVISNFRKHYEKTEIALISDAGDNFENLARKYNCAYFHGHRNMGINNLNFEKAQMFIGRLKFGCSVVQRKKIILLEDDVYIKGKITSLPPEYDFHGPVFGNVIQETASDILKKYGMSYPPTTPFGGSGGTIFTQRTINFYAKTLCSDRFNSFLEEMYDNVPQMKCVDYLFTMIMFYLGQNYGALPCLGEYARDPSCLTNPDIKVVHQLKDWSLVAGATK
jgi:hypothetical protein